MIVCTHPGCVNGEISLFETVECEECSDGVYTPEIVKKAPCRRCAGTGQLTFPKKGGKVTVLCSTCKGTGVFVRRFAGKERPCRVCGGTGQRVKRVGSQPCPQCGKARTLGSLADVLSDVSLG